MLLNRHYKVLKIQNLSSCAIVVHLHLFTCHLIGIGVHLQEACCAGCEEIAGQAGNDDYDEERFLHSLRSVEMTKMHLRLDI